MEAKSNDGPEIGERADAVQHTETTVQSSHASRSSRINIYFALLFLQSLPLKHSLASQWTDNKVVESLGKKYHTKCVCLGNIRDIWLAKVSENDWMVEDP